MPRDDSYPYTHTWVEGGIERQAQIHLANDGEEVVWAPAYPGQEQPWVSADHQHLRYDDDQISSLRR